MRRQHDFAGEQLDDRSEVPHRIVAKLFEQIAVEHPSARWR
jgi:hypothetical protein